MNGLEIIDLTVDFGNFKLDKISVGIKNGCITGLIGRNGAGKSTLIKTIMRQQDAVSGSILYCGMKYSEHEEEVMKSVACVFDSPHFNMNKKPKSIKKLYSAIYENFDCEMYDNLMKKFNLPSNLRLSRFSFGMQRKYCIILALCQKPDILLLDEPTSGIDPYDRNEVVGLIQEFMMDEEHTVLFSTHITEDLDKIADYIIMMDNGRIIIDEEKDSLIEKYRLVQCAELTDEMRKKALGVQKSMFGYVFLTTDTSLSEADGVQVKKPSLEEIFVHTLGFTAESGTPSPKAPQQIKSDDIFGL